MHKSSTPVRLREKPRVAIVDDERTYLLAWQEALTDAESVGFMDPEIFYDKVIENKEVLLSFSCIIFDFYFKGTDMDILKLVRTIRSRGFERPIILSTNALYKNDDNLPQDRFDAVIAKECMSFSELKNIPGAREIFERNSNIS